MIEYLASNFGKDPQLTQLLRTRELVITPMTNTYGYANDEREELALTAKGKTGSFDPNRDFPYNNSPSNCLNTVAGRTIYKLMVDNLFVTAITFHGGTNVIGYPWGSNNHILKRLSYYSAIAEEAPDFTALRYMGQAMNDASGNDIDLSESGFSIPKYILGSMTETVYSVGGGMEDWGYAAGWDNKTPDATFDKCAPVTLPALEDQFYESQANIRCAVYLVETDPYKSPNPSTYGARDIQQDGDDFQVLPYSIADQSLSSRFNGHITRNIRLALAMIDMSKPYIYV